MAGVASCCYIQNLTLVAHYDMDTHMSARDLLTLF
jgi:hypothetical protein